MGITTENHRSVPQWQYTNFQVLHYIQFDLQVFLYQTERPADELEDDFE